MYSATTNAVSLVDPLAVRAEGDPSSAVIKLTIPARMNRLRCDVVILGSELGGSAAALEAASRGVHVCMTEPTRWVGGQMTAQGVSAFDDNQWTETTGSSRSFQLLRRAIRAHYAPLLREGAKADATFNPGGCWVSYECSEASVDHAVLRAMLDPYIKSGRITLLLRSAPLSAEREGRSLKSVIVYGFDTHRMLQLTGSVFIDATALGEFLPMAGAEYVTGAESQGQTGEPDAPMFADPEAGQSFTYTFVLEQGKPQATVEKPVGYDNYLDKFSFDSTDADGKTWPYAMYGQLPNTPGSFWTYRRLIAKDEFKPGAFRSDLSMINWDSNDVCDSGLLSLDPAQQAKALQHGKQVSQAFAWWLQHQAPRDDKQGKGFPDLRIAGSAMNSADGLSQFPYVREGRRLKAIRTVREQDVVTKSLRAIRFDDTVGIGDYPIDIHACGLVQSLPVSKPYQIPLGSLESNNIDNLLAASKGIGTTHITNGAYRVHPTEWAIGDAAGVAAALAVKRHVSVKKMESDTSELRNLQRELILSGQPLVWFDDLAIDSPYFQSAQLASVLGLVEVTEDSLSFNPDAPVEEHEVAFAVHQLHARGALVADWSSSKDPLTSHVEWKTLAQIVPGAEGGRGEVKRGQFADWVVAQYMSGARTMQCEMHSCLGRK